MTYYSSYPGFYFWYVTKMINGAFKIKQETYLLGNETAVKHYLKQYILYAYHGR